MKKIRSTGTINFRDTHMGGFAVRGIDRQLVFSHKRRAQGPRDAMKAIHELHISAPRDLETLVCARGAKLSLEVVIEAPGISPLRKPRINLRPTGDGEACEDPR